ncbi:ligand-binding sensor domain-containing protein, partial [Pseudoduganella namucuonensis]|uniref:ligand-binding sensor domain-containing protein n=1 Tax=Pseudoduganella namucuonensis TaxID=1035707 RepID=UPI001160920D
MLRSLLFAAMTCLAMGADAQQLPLQHFGQKEGLGNLSVTALAQDAGGYLWAATENGLFRFDGAAFRRYGAVQGLAETFVTALHIGRSGMWVGTYEQLYRFHDGRFAPVLLDGKKLRVWPGQKMAEGANGELLLVTGGRLLAITPSREGATVRGYFDQSRIQAQAELAAIGSIHADPDGDLWMACGRSLCHASGGRVDVKGEADGLPAEPWGSIVRDTGGTLWIRGEQRIFALPAGAGRFEERTPPGDVLRKRMLRTELHVDEQGRVLTNADPGLLRWELGRWETFGKDNGLNAGGGVMAILRDRERGTWMATRGRGLVHWLGYGNWENWTSAQGLPDDVIISVQRDRGERLHVGTRAGHALQLPGGRRFSAVPAPSALAGHQWASMALDGGGNLWAGTYSGLLLRHAPERGATELVAKLPLINQVLPDRKGRMWVATGGGLHVFDETAPAGAKPPAVEDPAAPGRHPGNPVTSGCMDRQGRLWFSSLTDVLGHDGRAWRVLPFGPAVGKGELEKLVCARDGGLWAISLDTLWRVQVDGTPAATRVDAPVLRERALHSVYEDSRGWLWVGTDVGLAVWNRSRWRMLNQTHGLSWNDLNGLGFYEDGDGSMWVVTSNGLSHILRPERLFELIEPTAVIEGVQRGEREIAGGAAPLPWSPDPMVFRLASLQFQNRQGLRYRVRLVGMDERWSESSLPEVRYAALPAGDYRFQFVAVDSETGESSAPVERRFSIAPPWWGGYPFYGLCAAATLFAFLLFHRFRLRALTRRERELAVLVRERTGELERSREELRMRALK